MVCMSMTAVTIVCFCVSVVAAFSVFPKRPERLYASPATVDFVALQHVRVTMTFRIMKGFLQPLAIEGIHKGCACTTSSSEACIPSGRARNDIDGYHDNWPCSRRHHRYFDSLFPY